MSPNLVGCPDFLEDRLYQDHRTMLGKLVTYAVPDLVIDLDNSESAEGQATGSLMLRLFGYVGRSCKESDSLTPPNDVYSMVSWAKGIPSDVLTCLQVPRVAYYLLKWFSDLETLEPSIEG